MPILLSCITATSEHFTKTRAQYKLKDQVKATGLQLAINPSFCKYWVPLVETTLALFWRYSSVCPFIQQQGYTHLKET